MRKTLIGLGVLTLGVICLKGSVSAATADQSLKTVETELKSYLKTRKIPFTGRGYKTYLLNQLMFQKDKVLAKKSNYQDLLVYMAAYLDNETNQHPNFELQTVDGHVKEYQRVASEKTTPLSEAVKVNPEKVKEYTQKWWNHRNPEFQDWNPNNCMNYVSQLLFAGGVKMAAPTPVPDVNIYGGTHWYSYRKPDYVNQYCQSVSWINVNAFYDYWSQSQPVIEAAHLNIMQDAEVGDVVQLQSTAGGDWYHAMMVIDKDQETVYLTGNDNNRERMDIRDISNTNFRLIKFT
ncbi:amidase domain-containing protein [Latilactobacillus fragifolii]|uniref:amidase domain-containing protein n=1 Tax=Latilactobacillus fragifolii TaxID=2814244 RepID=UPI001ABA941A|nr:amidase domain-containing protein [Latilactobacillus fragifolii]